MTILKDFTTAKEYSYPEYRQLAEKLEEEGKTTGPEQSEDRIFYTRLNVARMKRIDKQVTLISEIFEALKLIKSKQKWYLLSEAWCGDGAQIAPIISRIADASPMIDLVVLLRDENLELMDSHLTAGKRSIPKLVCFDATTGMELCSWGPRPEALSTLIKELRWAEGEKKEELQNNIHLWYTKDKTVSTQKEIAEMIKAHFA